MLSVSGPSPLPPNGPKDATAHVETTISMREPAAGSNDTCSWRSADNLPLSGDRGQSVSVYKGTVYDGGQTLSCPSSDNVLQRLFVRTYQKASRHVVCQADDFGITCVSLECGNDKLTSASRPKLSVIGGLWSDVTSCPSGTFVCGVRLDYGDSAGSFMDASVWTGVRIVCCRPGWNADHDIETVKHSSNPGGPRARVRALSAISRCVVIAPMAALTMIVVLWAWTPCAVGRHGLVPCP
eukprot:TRINITY_DN33357_c0_g1_i1.p1 TRINITY_DN33357_c0_g1~~TRINITY_DN33357_c0_g1_i1.p1  ORF type:complete len:239 (+),score=13.51 TRINITY_DN33357_c0_g1_i1:232-948(+)